MTAEVAVMNKQGIALAADSAVTIGAATETKVLASANKIFALSKRHPVGVMIYGTASLLGVPWETIIKTYRQQLGDTGFDTVAEYVANFMAYLAADRELFPSTSQRDFVEETVLDLYHAIAQETRGRVRDRLRTGRAGDLGLDDAAAIASGLIAELHRIWSAQEARDFQTPGMAKALQSDYRRVFRDAYRQAFEKLPLDASMTDQLAELAVLLLTCVPPWDLGTETGVVIAGFGKRDVFPSFREIMIDGVASNQLVAWAGRGHAIENGVSNAFLGAFAQAEMVSRFMEGVDPDYQATLGDVLDSILSGFTAEVTRALGRRPSRRISQAIARAREGLLDDYQEELRRHRHETYVAGILSVIASQPLDQLADVAASLVSLTSFKRRVSMESETVSGPVDVAVISRGDGFIWIKRKHYFEAGLNQHFFANYYRED